MVVPSSPQKAVSSMAVQSSDHQVPPAQKMIVASEAQKPTPSSAASQDTPPLVLPEFIARLVLSLAVEPAFCSLSRAAAALLAFEPLLALLPHPGVAASESMSRG